MPDRFFGLGPGTDGPSGPGPGTGGAGRLERPHRPDPSGPAGADHGAVVRPDPDDLDRRLRQALARLAPPAGTAGVVAAVTGRADRRQRRNRLGLATAAAAVVLGLGLAASLAGQPGGSHPVSVRASGTARHGANRSPSATAVPTGKAGGAPRMAPEGAAAPFAASRPGEAAAGSPRSSPGATTAAPGAATAGGGVSAQSSADQPHPCTAASGGPPCGAGAIPGHAYAYLLPARCAGAILFDGRRFTAPQPDRWPTSATTGSIRLDTTPAATATFTGAGITLGLVPASGPAPICR